MQNYKNITLKYMTQMAR